MDFFTVFSAVLSAEICRMIIERYFKPKIEKGLDTFDETIKKGGNGGTDVF